MTTWKLIKEPVTGQENSVWREREDGKQESMLIIAEEYQKWLSEGNTPLPAENT